ncbi:MULTISPECIES: SMR family transporter [unclassified Lysinibacillus]|uniref:DMT family transporter n=1 Tax=unclassified Lysinibacillus TaxID=2636778 RepID=UPI002554D88A|nr:MULTISPECIES: SMR family transporter [unclassified Lysinibacillus]MDM5250974.1 SMR family transporter [Lysinibacillus sp. G4S2]
MGWLLVFLAAILETIGVIGLKKFSTTKSIKDAIILMAGFGGAFFFLYASFDYLQVSIAYAVWIGIGTTAAVIINMLFFGESKSMGRIVAVIVIVIGVSGLKYVS